MTDLEKEVRKLKQNLTKLRKELDCKIKKDLDQLRKEFDEHYGDYHPQDVESGRGDPD